MEGGWRVEEKVLGRGEAVETAMNGEDVAPAVDRMEDISVVAMHRRCACSDRRWSGGVAAVLRCCWWCH